MTPRGWKRIFRNPFRRGEPWTSVDDELDFHVEQKVDDLVADGWDRDAAEAEALRRFGDRRHWARRTAEESRRRRRAMVRRERLDAFVDDLRASVRHLRRRPLPSLTAVAVLVGGLAISVPVMAVLDQVLLRPAPFPEPERVVWLEVTTDQGRFAGATFQASGGAYLDWKGRQDVFEVMAATQWSDVPLGEERPERVRALRVEPSFFDVIGTRPVMGRAIRAEGTEGSGEVVLSHEVWTTRYGADPEILGRTVRVDGASWEVVGVMPERFRFWDMYGGETTPALLLSNPFVGWGGDPDLYTPAGRIQPVARLSRGLAVTAAQERLRSMVETLREERPEAYAITGAGESAPVILGVVPYLDLVRKPIRRSLVFIGGATVLLLVVIVANVSGIFAAAVGDRVRELTLRSALGASRRRIVGQVLLENGLLVAVSVAVGGALSRIVLPLLKTRIPGSVPRLQDAGFDLRVLSAVVVVVGFVWIMSSLPAVRHATRIDLRGVLAGVGQGSTRRRRLRWLLGVQIAVTTALLASAGVLVENQRRIGAVDPGFEPAGVHAIQLRAPGERYGEPADAGEFSLTRGGGFAEELEVTRVDVVFTDFVDRVVAELRSAPGVESASFVNTPPLGGRAIWGTGLVGAEPGDGFLQKWTEPAYAEVVGLRVVRGRWIGPQDVRGAEPVVVVNRSFVDHHLDEGVDPVGRVVTFVQGVSGGGLDTSATIVGVVDDVLQDPLHPGEPVLYQPLEQRATLWPETQDAFALQATFVVRAEAGVEEGALREAVWRVDPVVPIDALTDLSTALAGHLTQQRFFLILMAGFGLATLVMAAGGTGALVARRVQQVRREIGVRRALGATGRTAGAEVLRDVVLVACAGALLGMAASFWVDELLVTYLAGFSSDPVAVRIFTTLTVAAAAFATSARPAAMAVRVDPVEVLRAE